MAQPSIASTSPPSPLVLSDRLISLAEEAGRAGQQGAAEHLIRLAHSVLAPPRAARQLPKPLPRR
ncbi:MAG: hypothetical protein KGJ41_08535 [Rhodospirillales bacterium]|nr:hypothetical protein [Rhodospirillales bacterium]MDE2199056.1 hypothetical protein [Rhodospirillales bacterium]MDE2574894.1 hypothetical protein [Rhodospirillales bacterium]